MTPDPLALAVGGSDATFVSVVRNAAGTILAGQTVAYTSSDPTKATVGLNTGICHAVGAGTTTVTGTINGHTDTTVVTVAANTTPSTIVVAPTTMALAVSGPTGTVTATVANSAGAVLGSAVVTWTSGTPGVATVNSSTGVVTAVSAGSATITGTTTNSLTATCAVTVNVDTTPASVVVAPTTLAMIVGGADATLTATVSNASSSVISGAVVTWTSGSTGNATVNSSTGVVHAVNQGTATITATTTNGHTATCVATIQPDVTPAAVAISPTTMSLVVDFPNGAFSALATNAQGADIPGATITYSSSDTGVATVGSATGICVPVAAGTCTITATTANSKTATATVTVSPDLVPAAIVMTPNSLGLTVGGATGALRSTVTNAGGLTLGTATVVYSSSDTSIATVGSSSGVVTAVGPGIAIITATATSVTDTTDVTVSADTTPAAVAVSPSSAAITVGGADKTFTASVTNAAGAVLPGAPVTWSSSAPAIATVGTTTGTAHAVSAGSATITAHTANGHTATAALTVVANTTPNAIALAPTTMTLTVGGATGTITPTVTNSQGAVLSGQVVTYVSGTTSVATVGLTSGIVTAVDAGSATITASTSNGHTATCAVQVQPDVTPAAIVMTPNTLALAVGGSDKTFTSVVTNAELAVIAATVTYESSDATICTVDAASGVCHAVAAGSAVVTARTVNGLTDTSAVTVAADTTPASIVVSPATMALAVSGPTGTVTAVVANAAGAILGSAVVTWSTGNAGIATVNSSTGVVTAAGAGTTTITGTTTNALTGTCSVTVNVDTTPSTVTVAPTTLAMTVGQADSTVVATVKNAGGSVISGATIAWTSTNTAAATVNSSTGVVHAVAPGSTSITATTTNSKTASCAVTVAASSTPTSIAVAPTTLAMTLGGSDVTMTATVTGSSGVIPNSPVTWTSSSTAIATVGVSSGIVHAVSSGAFTITGTTSNGLTATASGTAVAAGLRTLRRPHIRTRIIARSPARDDATQRAFMNANYDDIEDTSANGTLAGHPNAISVQTYALLCMMEMDNGTAFSSGAWSASHDSGNASVMCRDFSAAYATAHGLNDEDFWLHSMTGDQNFACGITSITAAGVVNFNNPFSAGQVTTFPFHVGQTVTFSGLPTGNGTYTLASLNQHGVVLTGWAGGDLSLGATPGTSSIGTMYVPGTGTKLNANRKWFFYFSEWRQIPNFGNTGCQAMHASRFVKIMQNGGAPINAALIDEMDTSMYTNPRPQSVEYGTTGGTTFGASVTCQFSTDLAACLTRIRAEPGGPTYLRVNTASHAFVCDAQVTHAAGGAHCEQLMDIFHSDTSWLDYWIARLNAGDDAEFVDGDSWSLGVMTTSGSYTAGNYTSASLRRQMASLAMYYMGVDATRTLPDGTTQKHAIIDLTNSAAGDIPLSNKFTPAFNYNIGQPTGAYARGANVTPPTGQAVRLLTRTFSLDGGTTASAYAILCMTSGTPPAGVTASNFDDTSVVSVALPAAPSGKQWFLLNGEGTTATSSTTTASIRRAEGLIFVALGNVIHVAPNGSDSTGTGSQAAPYLTFSHAQSGAPAGAIIQGLGGSTFRETITVQNNSLAFGSYGTGNAIISGANVVTGWAVSGSGTKTYQVSLATQPLMLYVNDVRATIGSGAASLTVGQWFWTGGVLYFRSDFGNPDALGTVIEASQRNYCVDQNGKTGMTLSGLTFRRSQHTSNGALFLHVAGTAENFSITGCTIKENYTTGIYNLVDSASGNISGNTISDNGQHGVWYATSTTVGSTGQTINTNTVTNNGWRTDPNTFFPSGIIGHIKSGSIAFNTLTGNGITGSGNHAHAIYASGDLPAGGTLLIHDNVCSGQFDGYGIKCTQDATIYNNTLTNNQGGGANLGPNTGSNNVTITFHHNVISGCARTNGGGLDVTKSANSGVLSFSGYNNTLYDNSSGSSAGEFFLESNCGTLNFKNNIIDASGTTGKAIRMVTQSGTIAIDYNNYFGGDPSTPIVYNGTQMSVATWKGQAFTPDAHAITTNPLFTNPGTDFTLQAGSGAKGTGVVIANITTGTTPNRGAL